jgi:hypothetical protein
MVLERGGRVSIARISQGKAKSNRHIFIFGFQYVAKKIEG